MYPATVPTLPDQLAAEGLTWKGYEEDMGNVPSRESATCGHPTVGGKDNTATALQGDGYASGTTRSSTFTPLSRMPLSAIPTLFRWVIPLESCHRCSDRELPVWSLTSGRWRRPQLQLHYAESLR